jgi:hypothetical protein
MNWMRFAGVVIGAGVVTSFTDWFFAGDWIHKRFSYPEIWREGSETKAVVVVSILPFVTAAVFAVLVWRFDVASLRNCVKLALAVWTMAVLPMILANAAFIKLHRVFTVLYATGWLVKLLIVAVAVAKFLHF